MLLTRMFPAEPWAAHAARRIVEMTTAPEIPPKVAHDLSVVASEFVTNAIKHGAGPVELRVWVEPRRPLRIEVSNRGGGFEPELPPAPPTSGRDSGWGLYVVDQLANRWGVDAQAGMIWAEFDIWKPIPRR